ncbi:hypothetical protein [Sphingomonas sp. MMS24-J13]|uniref:hypothetical protein n=1 Tax=Sphingomonas sp. MMS24-J13 TaxID=3238686 RepID=UPI00384C1052
MGAIDNIVPADEVQPGPIGKIINGLELWAPDLRDLPPLEHFLALLDEAVGDPASYAEVWLDVTSTCFGAPGASVSWQPNDADDADPELHGCWIACDDLFDQRKLWSDAIRAHKGDDPEKRTAIIKLLLSRGEYHDNRKAPRRRVFKAMRAFLDHGGRLMINPKGRFALGGCWPAHRDDIRTEEQLDDALESLIELHTMARRWKGMKLISRAVRILGKSYSGWTVLEANDARAVKHG